jgi:hypothetical protein
MDASMLLCDWAEEIKGKLYIMGGGWNRVGSATPINMALAVLLKVGWNETNIRHTVSVRLVAPDSHETIEAEGRRIEANVPFEVGRPAGVTPASDFNTPFAFRFLGVRLKPGRYIWRCETGDQLLAESAFDVVR